MPKKGPPSDLVLPPVIPEEESSVPIPAAVAAKNDSPKSPADEKNEAPPKLPGLDRTTLIRFLAALGVVALLVAGAVFFRPGEGSGPDAQNEKATDSQSGPATAASVALKLADLPEGFLRCSFSGSIQTYLKNLKFPAPDTYQGNLVAWNRLRELGATAAYMAYYGEPQSSCDFVLGGTHPGGELNHNLSHPRTAFSMVAQFPDSETAAKAYQSDVLGQSTMLNANRFDSKQGAESGLGANSIVGDMKAQLPTKQAVWQNQGFLILYGSENVPSEKAINALEAMNDRIRP